jgi:MFS superfamily sulfate permease-like transporter
VILDFGPNPQLDITTSENLEQLVKTLRGGGIDFALAEVRRNVRDTARRTGLVEAIGEDHLFHTLDEAVDAMESP